MSSNRDGLARSVQTRLARHARAIGTDPNLVLTRYAVERFLYRLSISPHVDRFVLKGALLMLAWLGDALRPTRDADLLGFGDLSDEALGQIFTDVCEVDAVVPPATWLDYPSLLDLPIPHLRAYRPETVIAEKLHAIVVLGSRNSRMKDYFDLRALAHEGVLDAHLLGDAIAATFQRRGTVVPWMCPSV